jgi:hypothetical protein
MLITHLDAIIDLIEVVKVVAYILLITLKYYHTL